MQKGREPREIQEGIKKESGGCQVSQWAGSSPSPGEIGQERQAFKEGAGRERLVRGGMRGGRVPAAGISGNIFISLNKNITDFPA